MREWLGQTRSFALGVLVVGAIAACNSAHRGDNGTSETHFLRSCTESCADGYSCLCGVCTLACDDDAVCMAEGSRSAICGAPSADRNECGGVTRLCDMRCGGDGDCRALGGEFSCEAGRCRGPSVPVDAGTAAGRGAGTGGRSGSAGGGTAGTAGPIDGGAVVDGGSATCSLPAAPGSCFAAIPRYYHDSATGSCKQFTYGGCGGNANNFETLDACEGECGGGSPSVCELPPETGPCEALFRRYYHDSATGSCEQFTYGGCEGNANNFETLAACQAACEDSSGDAACEVNGIVYPSGADGIDDPTSCNKCSCIDGQLGCTDAFCPEPCPAGTAFGVSCSQCGPTDACEVVRMDCLPSCETSDDCTGDAPPSCFNGTCRNLCG